VSLHENEASKSCGFNRVKIVFLGLLFDYQAPTLIWVLLILSFFTHEKTDNVCAEAFLS
jgi:hypothetical protein